MSNKGYSLIELMITIAIILVVSAMSYVSINGRLKVSRLESAVETIVSDLSYARSAAMLKGCPTRFIFCNDPLCTNQSVSSITLGRDAIGSGSEATHYYTIFRMSQAIDANAMCYNASAVPEATDDFAYWDFERKPIQVPRGVSFFPIYYNSSGVPYQGNWFTTTSSEANNSIWFESDGDLHVPITDFADSSGLSYNIVFQMGLDDCTPTAEEDCIAYLIGIPSTGGTAKSFRCEVGAGTQRSSHNSSNVKCF